jgi:hypothetical protein
LVSGFIGCGLGWDGNGTPVVGGDGDALIMVDFLWASGRAVGRDEFGIAGVEAVSQAASQECRRGERKLSDELEGSGSNELEFSSDDVDISCWGYNSGAQQRLHAVYV